MDKLNKKYAHFDNVFNKAKDEYSELLCRMFHDVVLGNKVDYYSIPDNNKLNMLLFVQNLCIREKIEEQYKEKVNEPNFEVYVKNIFTTKNNKMYSIAALYCGLLNSSIWGPKLKAIMVLAYSKLKEIFYEIINLFCNDNKFDYIHLIDIEYVEQIFIDYPNMIKRFDTCKSIEKINKSIIMKLYSEEPIILFKMLDGNLLTNPSDIINNNSDKKYLLNLPLKIIDDMCKNSPSIISPHLKYYVIHNGSTTICNSIRIMHEKINYPYIVIELLKIVKCLNFFKKEIISKIYELNDEIVLQNLYSFDIFDDFSGIYNDLKVKIYLDNPHFFLYMLSKSSSSDFSDNSIYYLQKLYNEYQEQFLEIIQIKVVNNFSDFKLPTKFTNNQDVAIKLCDVGYKIYNLKIKTIETLWYNFPSLQNKIIDDFCNYIDKHSLKNKWMKLNQNILEKIKEKYESNQKKHNK